MTCDSCRLGRCCGYCACCRPVTRFVIQLEEQLQTLKESLAKYEPPEDECVAKHLERVVLPVVYCHNDGMYCWDPFFPRRSFQMLGHLREHLKLVYEVESLDLAGLTWLDATFLRGHSLGSPRI